MKDLCSGSFFMPCGRVPTGMRQEEVTIGPPNVSPNACEKDLSSKFSFADTTFANPNASLSSQDVNYEMTSQGFLCPVALKPFLDQGKPLCYVPKLDPTLLLNVSRFPTNSDLSLLTQPIQVLKEPIQDVSQTTSQLPTETSNFLRVPTPKNAQHLEIWRLVDALGKQLVGRPTDVHTSNYFISIDKGDFIEILPLDSWYSFYADLPRRQLGPMSSDVAERKRRAALYREEKAELDFLKKQLEKDNADREDIEYTLAKYRQSKMSSSSQSLNNLYAEDAGLSSQQRKRLKQIIKSRRRAVRLDDEDPGDSALNVGYIKRATVDWDWEDDGKASDDEEDYEERSIVDDYDGQASDQEEEILTKCGQQINSALETLKEQDAEDELVQFSDDGDDDEEEEAKEDEEQDETKKNNENKTSPSSDVQRNTSEAFEAPSDGAAGTKMSSSHPSTQIDPSSPSLTEVTREKNVHPWQSSDPPSKKLRESTTVKTGGASKDHVDGRKTNPENQRLTSAGVRQRVIRTLSLHGGRMPTKKFIQSFNITSNKSELFKLIRKTINEVCEVQTEYENGEAVKILELKSQFRPS